MLPYFFASLGAHYCWCDCSLRHPPFTRAHGNTKMPRGRPGTTHGETNVPRDSSRRHRATNVSTIMSTVRMLTGQRTLATKRESTHGPSAVPAVIRSLFLRLVNKACSRRVTWVLFTYGILIIRLVPFLFGIGPYYKGAHMLLKSRQFGAAFRVPGQSQNQTLVGIAQDQYALNAAPPCNRRQVL